MLLAQAKPRLSERDQPHVRKLLAIAAADPSSEALSTTSTS
jgi:hypothetical protein